MHISEVLHARFHYTVPHSMASFDGNGVECRSRPQPEKTPRRAHREKIQPHSQYVRCDIKNIYKGLSNENVDHLSTSKHQIVMVPPHTEPLVASAAGATCPSKNNSDQTRSTYRNSYSSDTG